ncbi:hypothetical protein ACLIKD_12680 [Azonexus sp. IMCC34842]|uniref:hypothetical protein n=1 Tax=Azonexus sp. IMCC34842 TaxID=3420950 RepID=UPI003D1372D5
MFNVRLLSACITLSLIVHAVIFMLLEFRVAKDVGSDQFASSSQQFNVTLRRYPEAGSIPLEKIKPLPYAQELSWPTVIEPPVIREQGIVGNIDKSPVLALSVDDYLPPSRLDRIPRPLSAVDTSISFRGMGRVVGEAEIILLISSSGEIDDVLILGSSLPRFVVEEVANRFKQIRFEPGGVGKWAVRSRLRIRLEPPSDDELLGNPFSAREKARR